jgi:hypothetical protein
VRELIDARVDQAPVLLWHIHCAGVFMNGDPGTRTDRLLQHIDDDLKMGPHPSYKKTTMAIDPRWHGASYGYSFWHDQAEFWANEMVGNKYDITKGIYFDTAGRFHKNAFIKAGSFEEDAEFMSHEFLAGRNYLIKRIRDVLPESVLVANIGGGRPNLPRDVIACLDGVTVEGDRDFRKDILQFGSFIETTRRARRNYCVSWHSPSRLPWVMEGSHWTQRTQGGTK